MKFLNEIYSVNFCVGGGGRGSVIPQAAQSLKGLNVLNIYTEYLTVIIFNNEIIKKILTIYVKNISNLLIECICCVSESSCMMRLVYVFVALERSSILTLNDIG